MCVENGCGSKKYVIFKGYRWFLFWLGDLLFVYIYEWIWDMIEDKMLFLYNGLKGFEEF